MSLGPMTHHGQLVDIQAREPRHHHHHHGHHHHHRELDEREPHHVVIIDGKHHHRHGNHGVVHIHTRELEEREAHHDIVVIDGHRHRHHRHGVTVIEGRDLEERHRHHRHHHHHHRHHRRDEDCDELPAKRGLPDGSPGYIDVTSPSTNASHPTTIASLVLSTDNGTDTNSTFVLNASTNMKTQMYLYPLYPEAAEGGIEVNLRIPVFVSSTATTEEYCATFDGAPTSPAPLTVTPCHNGTVVDPHVSQVFLYDSATGVISPEWQSSEAAVADSSNTTMADGMGEDGMEGDDADDTEDDGEDELEGDDNTDPSMSVSSLPSATLAPASASSSSKSITYSPLPSATEAPLDPTAEDDTDSDGAMDVPDSALPSEVSDEEVPSSSIQALQTDGPKSSTASTPFKSDMHSSNVTLVFSPASPSTSDEEQSEEVEEMALDPYPEGDAPRSPGSSSTQSLSAKMSDDPTTSAWIYHSPYSHAPYTTSIEPSAPSSTASLSTPPARRTYPPSKRNVGDFVQMPLQFRENVSLAHV